MFDSGFGGLTVARATIDLLPNEDLVYLGDTARYPYGSRSLDEVRAFSVEIAHHLVERYDIKLLVVACNTATAAALETLEKILPVPVIGVIEPGVRALGQASQSGRLGVIGTVGTTSSGAYDQAVLSASPGAVLTSCACPGFVEFVERGVTSGPEVTLLARRLLAPISEAKVDALLLGCTHYPYLARVIADVVGRGVVLVSSADETAFALSDLLNELGLAVADRRRNGRQEFVSSGDIRAFTELGSRLLGPELVDATLWRPEFGSNIGPAGPEPAT
jgi:glutamate racemase